MLIETEGVLEVITVILRCHDVTAEVVAAITVGLGRLGNGEGFGGISELSGHGGLRDIGG